MASPSAIFTWSAPTLGVLPFTVKSHPAVEPVEDAAMAYPLIKDCICIPVEHKITGTALKLLVVMLDGHTLDKRALALHLKSRLEPYKIPLLYEAVPAIQRTFNGKLNRKAYMNPSF